MSWITHNFAWKLGSVMLSVLLWIAVLGEPELVTTHVVPVLFKNLPRNLLIGSNTPESVHVELRGPSSRLAPSNLAELAIVLDLGDVRGPDERTFTLSDNDLHLPQGVSFLRVVPSQLRLQFARLETKNVIVTPRISGGPGAGYRIVKREVIPPNLEIAGPERLVAQADGAETDAIELGGVTETREYHVNAFLEDPQLRFTTSPAVIVKVTIEKDLN